MAPGPTQLLHGLRLSGDVALPGAAPADGPADFEVRLSPPEAVPEAPPEGEVVAALPGPGAGYAAAQRPESLAVRFFETADFEVDLTGGTIAARPAPGRGEVMVPVLLAGNVVALILGLKGACVLHASAVELEGTCVAFVGPSGAGKSTAAALLCGAGGALVSDDAARVEADGDGFLVHRGPQELRLRPQAEGLAERVGGARRTTGDERVGVEMGAATEDTTRLGAIVFPRWPRGESEVAVSPVGQREALDALLRCPRVIGWRAQEPISAHFRACTDLAEAVPAFRLELPHGHLDDGELPGALRGALVEALASSGVG